MSKSAGINFGIPESEYRLRVDDTGAATSCYNQDTDTEYIGGGGDSGIKKVTIQCTAATGQSNTLYPNGAAIDNGVLLEDFVCAIPYNDPDYGFAAEFDGVPVRDTEPATIEVWVIDGHSFYIGGSDISDVFEVSGDAEAVTYDFGGGTIANIVIVSGDCSINYLGEGE